MEKWNLRFKEVIELIQKSTVTKGYTCIHIKFSYPQVQCPFSHTYFIIFHQMSTSLEDPSQQCLTRNWNNAIWVLFEIMPIFFFFLRWSKDSLESAGWLDIQALEREKEGSGITVRWSITDPHKLVDIRWISCVQVYWRTCHSHVGLWGRGKLIHVNMQKCFK